MARAARAYFLSFGRWYAHYRHTIASSVSVIPGQREGRPLTTIRVRHRFPFPAGRAWYLVTTRPRRVTGWEFGADAEVINRASTAGEPAGGPHREGTGRVLHFVDLRSSTQRVVAALALHIPVARNAPPLVRTAAGTRDPDGAMGEESIVALLMLKAYAHVISVKLGRGGHLRARATSRQDEELFERLGFTRVSSAAASGEYEQPPYRDLL